MKFLLQNLVVVLLMVASSATLHAQTNTSTGALSDLQSVVNATPPNGIVNILAGSNNWNGTLIITNDIQLLGAGTNLTIIMDTNATAIQIIDWTTHSNHFNRLSGVQFLGSTNVIGTTSFTAIGTYSLLIHGTSKAVMVDHCYFSTLQTPYNLVYGDWTYGVINNNTWNLKGQDGAMQMGCGHFGDKDWAYGETLGAGNVRGRHQMIGGILMPSMLRTTL